ncbi:hypothetical protein C5952_03570 [Cronobacter sakazakii]|nr:hypothetical protein [Escherichia coli]EFN7269634.1 hypothetical protein [Escherichia coli O21]PQX67614.1 hypothetical protein C5952_03570 [Cronobacter sakazakii]EEW0711977.1 hypothetical protein [Escherichia coli]EEW2321296.1 hypothetical protein [Escherichia coli]
MQTEPLAEHTDAIAYKHLQGMKPPYQLIVKMRRQQQHLIHMSLTANLENIDLQSLCFRWELHTF